jgi:hypothetical protein
VDGEQFIAGIKVAVLDSAVKGTISCLEKPLKRASSTDIAASEWFKRLSPEDRTFVEYAVRHAASGAVARFMSVLDGAIVSEPAGPKGTLELFYVRGHERVHLNDPKLDEMCTLYAAVTAPQRGLRS